MDLSKVLKDTLLGSSSVKAISKSSGADESKVQQALSDALPALIKGMHKNASSQDGEKSLVKALSDHAGDDTSDVVSFLKNVDTKDGQKIISHILGSGKKTVEKSIAKRTGLKSGQISDILATAAPLLLNVLGKKKDEDKKDSEGIVEILASALLGGDKKDDDDNDLGDVLVSGLGSLLGGKKKKKKKDDLGGLIVDGLGSLLGGDDDKKKPAKKKKTEAKKPTSKKKKTEKKPTSKKKK